MKLDVIKNIDNSNVQENNIEIVKLSASAAKTYDQCPRKYFYTYIERLPRKKWDHFDLGNLCHRTLEIFHKVYIKYGLRKHRSLSKLMSYSFKKARKEFPNMNDILLSEAKDLCAGYLSKIKKEGMPLVKGVETSFDFYIREDVRIRGFLDRLDITKDGKFHIVDYKTTKNAKYLDKFQLLVYGMWLKEQNPDMNAFKGSYVLLRHGSKNKEYDFNKEDIEKTKKELLACADSIKNENSWTPIPQILCKWCDFKNVCPAQKAW